MPVTLRPRCNLGIEAKNAASGFTDVMVFGLVQFGLESLFFYAISTSAAAATGLYRYCLAEKNGSNEASKLWSHHEETRELPGEIDNARNNARCTQARKTTHGLDGQHQGVDRTPSGRVNQNDRGQR